jgi:predicted nuclease of restriction endonuclease-like (RecB) superfamily
MGLKHQILEETELEDALLDHLQEFLLELGHGFCFEARQKQINLGLMAINSRLIWIHRNIKNTLFSLSQ